MHFNLEKIDEFKKVLKDYSISDENKQILHEHPLVIMLGVSGGGRNTVINHLVNSDDYHFIISDTTRPPKIRDGALEQNGMQYNFRKEYEVLRDLQQGNFLEAELIHNQQVSGISLGELHKAYDSGKVPINEVDLGGTEAIYKAKEDTLFIFLVPPSYKEWMYRLQGREVMTDRELSNRLHTAKKVLESGLSSDRFTFIVNESSHASAIQIDSIVKGEIDQATYDDSEGRAIAQELLTEIS